MKWFKNIKRFFNRISFVDKCLLLFMLIFILQICYTLFINDNLSQNASTIDTVIRSSAAAIFGYFLSENFLKYSKCKVSKDGSLECEIKVPIQDVANSCNKNQAIIITFIGVLSLIVLLISRDLVNISNQAAAAISQLRDFVSATVGFLVSCGKGHTDDST